MLNLYLRKEPTTDVLLIERNATKNRFDIVAYRDAGCTIPAARWSWHYSSKPKRGNATVMFNCYRWNAVWR